MNDNCITRFEVSNFKKFDHLVVENIGQVNLITGDNNVGKTTLLEALLCNENNLRWICYLHQLLTIRGIHIAPTMLKTTNPTFPNENFLAYIIKNIDAKIICKLQKISKETIELALEYKNIKNLTSEDKSYRKDKYNVENVRDWVLFYKNNRIDELQWLYYDNMEFANPLRYWPLISLNNVYGGDLNEYIQIIANEDYLDKQNIISYLKIWIDDILDYKISNFGQSNLIGIATNNDITYQSLTTFGDGFQKYFRYVVEILFAKKISESRIMIDEIDVGVHYLKMKDEWKAIFELSQQTGIQIFATTHSMDCIKAFVEAGQENEAIKNDLRLIELEEFTAKDGNVKQTAYSFDFKSIEQNLQTETNMRGGKIWR